MRLRSGGPQRGDSHRTGTTHARRSAFRHTPRFLVLAVLVALVAPAHAVAGTLDQSQTATDASFSFGGQRQVAQTFTAGRSGHLDQVEVHVRRDVPPSSLSTCNHGSGITAEIRTLTGGSPSNTTLGTTTVPATSVPTVFDWIAPTFATPPSVTAGTQYALVLSATDASCTGFWFPYSWSAKSANPYIAGAAFAKLDSGSSWAVQGTTDTTFKTYVAAVPPSDTTPPPEQSPPPAEPTPAAGDPAGDSTTPSASPEQFSRELTVSYLEKKNRFRGRLTSESGVCIGGHAVRVFRKRKGKDRRVGAVTSMATGKYALKTGALKGRYYAKVKEVSLPGASCSAAKSKTIRVSSP